MKSSFITTLPRIFPTQSVRSNGHFMLEWKLYGFLILLVLLGEGMAFAHDFRKADWGMSKEEVKATEQGPPGHETDKLIAYKTSLLNEDTLIIYIFAQEKLVRARYLFSSKYFNKNKYVYMFEELNTILSKKYGQPKEEKKYFDSDYYRSHPSEWGNGIGHGKVEFYNTWNDNETTIMSYLYGEQLSIYCGVEYRSKKLHALEANENEKEALDQL